LLKAIILTGAVTVALVTYFSLSLYVFPQSYQMIATRRPQPIVTDVSLSESAITLGQVLTISVTGTNIGEDDADMQIVSVGFPNLTTTDDIKVLKHNFDQTPMFISPGKLLSSGYSDSDSTLPAQYASIEAFNRPWKAGKTSTVDIEVTPKTEGRFVIFVKSVALPHTWEQAHFPQNGILDPQKEFVETYSVDITKP